MWNFRRASLINSIDKYPYVKKALRGINVAVAALLTSVIVKFAQKTVKTFVNFLFMLLGFVLVFFFKVPSFYIIIGAIIIGLIISIVRCKRAGEVK